MKVIKSYPFMQKAVFAFVLKNNAIPVSVEDLSGKRVGLVHGYTYPISVTDNDKIKADYAPDATNSMKKLEAGRIAVVLDDINVGKEAIIKTGVKDVIYNDKTPFAMIDVFFAFHATSEGEKLEKEFSKAIREMKADGILERFISRPKN